AAALAHWVSRTKALRSALQTWSCAPWQRRWPLEQTALAQPEELHSGALGHCCSCTKPVRSALQTWSCAPWQRRSSGAQLGARQAPARGSHKAALAQSSRRVAALPSELHAISRVPSQLTVPGVQAKLTQLP